MRMPKGGTLVRGGVESAFVVRAHLKRMLQGTKIEGLWAWRTVAASLHLAKIPVHSGTVPVERFWASLKEMLPGRARHISHEWFTVIANLVFLRYNYRLANQGTLPTFAQRDSLIAQSIAAIESLLHAVESLSDPQEAQGFRSVLHNFS